MGKLRAICMLGSNEHVKESMYSSRGSATEKCNSELPESRRQETTDDLKIRQEANREL